MLDRTSPSSGGVVTPAQIEDLPVNGRDYPAVVGVVLVISILFVTLNFVVDILYAVLDPRVRHG